MGNFLGLSQSFVVVLEEFVCLQNRFLRMYNVGKDHDRLPDVEITIKNAHRGLDKNVRRLYTQFIEREFLIKQKFPNHSSDQ